MTKKGFIEYNGYQLVHEEKGKSCELRVDLKDESLNPYGFAHGGLIFGLGDTAMGLVAYSTGRGAVTQSSNITFLRPTTGSYLVAKAQMIKDGKKVCFLNCDFFDENDKLTATMNGSYYYIDKEN